MSNESESEKDRRVVEFRKIENIYDTTPKPSKRGKANAVNAEIANKYYEAKDAYEEAVESIQTDYEDEQNHIGIREILHELEKAECDVDYEGFTRYNNLENDTYYYENAEYAENEERRLERQDED